MLGLNKRSLSRVKLHCLYTDSSNQIRGTRHPITGRDCSIGFIDFNALNRKVENVFFLNTGGESNTFKVLHLP